MKKLFFNSQLTIAQKFRPAAYPTFFFIAFYSFHEKYFGCRVLVFHGISSRCTLYFGVATLAAADLARAETKERPGRFSVGL